MKKERLILLGWVLSIMAVTFPFVGCASSNIGETKTICEDGFVYNEKIGTKKEIAFKDNGFIPCRDGEINLN